MTHIELYKSELIPALDMAGLKNQEKLFEDDYRNFGSKKQLKILLEIKKEIIKRLQAEVDEFEKYIR